VKLAPSVTWTILFPLATLLAATAQLPADSGWPAYGNDPGGARYSGLAQIDRSNVTQLRVAWTFRTGALQPESPLNRKAAFEATPILVDGKLLLSTPFNNVIALDPRTGTRLWEYDPALDRARSYSEVTARGVSAWRDTKAPPGQACRLRIFAATLDARLTALDGDTGRPCADFGAQGQIDLTRGVGLRDLGQYQVTSAPAIAGDVVITGSSIGDNRAVDVERGIVRAFDARSGALRWSWDPIPWASQTTPRTGGGNAWSTLSVDTERGLVFVPTGSASPDHFGGVRRGDNKWANSVVALRAATGELVWGFQVVHHDLWDYDVAAQPTLFTWKDGTPAVAIATKMGRIFVLNRLTGVPLLPVEERPVPRSDVPGEDASPTQPFSGVSVAPEQFGVADAWGATPEDLAWCREKISASRAEGVFTPPSLRGTIVFPGFVGGVNWGSGAYDAQRHLLFVNTNRLPFLLRLIPRDKLAEEAARAGQVGGVRAELAEQKGTLYGMSRVPLLTPTRRPCNPPPWGTVAAVDLFSGEKRWDVPLGSTAPGVATGTLNLGGPIATAGGLVFTAAAMDNRLRAFDSDTGKELWAFELPAGGQATPMTYSVDGTQYLVIAAGGHGKLGTKLGDYVLGFSLHGGPDMAPKPPGARRVPAEP
jgi:quinoprotein glucose dehydrogenase